jgi:hypothetical protein
MGSLAGGAGLRVLQQAHAPGLVEPHHRNGQWPVPAGDHAAPVPGFPTSPPLSRSRRIISRARYTILGADFTLAPFNLTIPIAKSKKQQKIIDQIYIARDSPSATPQDLAAALTRLVRYY